MIAFEPTPEIIKQMIQFESQLNYHSYSDYQSKMIQQFYQYYDKDHPNYDIHMHYRADLDTINQMTEWIKYPTCEIITIDDLKKIEMKIANDLINGPEYIWQGRGLGDRKLYWTMLTNTTGFGYAGYSTCNFKLLDWNHLIAIIKIGGSGFYPMPGGNFSIGHIEMHARFVDSIYTIWTGRHQQPQQPISTSSISYVQYNELKQINADLQQQLTLANQKIAMLASEFHFEFTLLKQQNAELLHQRNNYPVATAVAIAAPSTSDDPNDTKMHLARNISTQNLSEWMGQ